MDRLRILWEASVESSGVTTSMRRGLLILVLAATSVPLTGGEAVLRSLEGNLPAMALSSRPDVSRKMPH